MSVIHVCQISRPNMSESGFVTADHKPTWNEKHASEGLIAQFQDRAALGSEKCGLYLLLRSLAQVRCWASLMRELRHKAVVPKLCFKLESLGIWNRTNEKRCLGPTPRLCHFTGLGWDLIVWIFKSSSGDSARQSSLEISNEVKFWQDCCQCKKALWEHLEF